MSGKPPLRPIKRLLIANRGEIATRILSTARELSLESYTLYTADDVSHTFGSTYSIKLASASSYLNIDELVKIVKNHQIDAVHPGYGFLSESAEFAERMWREAEAVVIGPGWGVLARTGDKLAAKSLAEECKVPILSAISTATDQLEDVKLFAEEVGYPVIIKAVDGGGGRGIRIVRAAEELKVMMERAVRESPAGKVFVEKAALEGFRHVEVQIVGDGHGAVRHLWERECSIQRRFQKVVEFAPCSIEDRTLVGEMIEAAVRMAKRVGYMSLGTFEFLARQFPPEFYFLEVNPRLQVEHTITESMCMGIDLVKIQLQIAMGKKLAEIINLSEDPKIPPPLSSIQLRVTAEDASHDWSLSVGKISSINLPSGHGIRVDTHMLRSPSTIVNTDFDSLLAKIVVTSSSWEDSIAKCQRALADTRIDGVKTSLDALRGILASEDFLKKRCDTQWLERCLPRIMRSGLSLTAELSRGSLLQQIGKFTTVAVGGAASGVPFRKGDAWTVILAPTDESGNMIEGSPSPGHLQLTRVLRNEFPQSLSAQILYTRPSGSLNSYKMTMTATSASAGILASSNKHRRGDPSNPNHIIIPFPGQLMEILVEVDDVIGKGEVVAVVRQMKMELEIRASKGGRVVWTFEGEEGEDVGEGLLIAEVGDVISGTPKL